MELDKSLRPECIELDVAATTKQSILETIAEVAKRSPILENISQERILQALVARENVGSTGFEDGIAIPHCRMAGLNHFVAGLITTPKGVAFDAMDDRPTHFFFFVIGPDDRNAYVRLLSNISRVAGRADIRKKLSASTSSMGAYAILIDHSDSSKAVVQNVALCSFQIVVQCEDRFTDILQAVSALTDGVDVVETRGVGHYLHRLPIFSTFWTSEEKQFHRLILGVIPRDLVNELARGVNVAAGGLDDQPGVLLAVQDCLFCQGSLES
ncbi:hypothetical protein BVX99_03485 [bacterium F16]|nr:hypothetical protein BVX99_03485 [bacterium F16]